MDGRSEFTSADASDSATLVRLDRHIAGLDARLGAVDAELHRLDARASVLRRDRVALIEQRATMTARRTAVAAQMNRHRAAPPLPVSAAPAAVPTPTAAPAVPSPAAVPTPAPVQRVTATAPTPEPAGPAPSPAEPTPAVAPEPREEASARSVQAVLLTLGGLLLGVAAITFTAVAWTTFGPTGRAAILGTVTVVALLVPWLLSRRGLTATAETISAVALLLVALDGYAAWSVGLFGVDRFAAPPGYAGVVLVLTALAATGYRAVAPLVVPRYVAVLAAQPVLPLLVAGAAGGSGDAASDGGWFPAVGTAEGTAAFAGAAILAAAVAAQNIAMAAAMGRRERSATTGPLVLAWVLFAVGLAVAGIAAAVATVFAPTAGTAALAGLALVVTASVGVAAAVTVGQPWARATAGAGAAVAVLFGIGVPAGQLWPDATTAPFAAAVAVAAYGIRAVPAVWRRGVAAGVTGCAALAGAAAGTGALVAASERVTPLDSVWETGPAPHVGWSWSLPATLLLLGVAAVPVRARDTRHHLVVAAVALAGLAASAGPGGTASWAAPVISLTVALGFGAATVAPGTGRRLAARGVAAGVLALHAVAVGLAWQWSTAVVLGALTVAGATFAAGGRRARGTVRAYHLGTAFATLPGAVTAIAGLAGSSTVDLRTIALGTAALVVAGSAAAAVRRGAPDLPVAAGAATGALSVLAVGTGGASDVLVAGLAPVAALIGVAGARAARPDSPGIRTAYLAGGLTAVAATLARAVAIALPGTGLVAAAAAAAALAAGAAVATRRWRAGTAAGAMVVGGTLTVIMLPVAGAAGGAAAWLAVRDPWNAGLDDWPRLARLVAPFDWQLPAALALLIVAALALARRSDRAPYGYAAAVVGGAALLLAAPTALGLPWWTPVALSGAGALGLAVFSARLRAGREVLFTAVVAGGLGGHAAVASLTRAGGTAIVLGATVAGCVLVAATARHPRLRDAAVGGALAAAPGAAAATAAALDARAALVLSLGLATASVTLGTASILGLVRRAGAAVAGAVAGSLICVGVALVTPHATGWDHLAAVLLLIGALARVIGRRRESRGAAGATLALTAELSQLVALLVPGAPLLTTALVVALVALAVRQLPADWRPGPSGGVSLAGVAVAATAGLAAVLDAADVVATLSPWGTDLDTWLRPQPVGADLVGWQPAAALLVLAATAVAFGRRRESADRTTAFAVTAAALAAVHAPVGFGLAWWAPSTVAGLAALLLGCLATRVPVRWIGILSAVLAAGLAGYAGAASLARPAHTATVLCGLVAAAAVVALVAAAAGRATAAEAVPATAAGTGTVAQATAAGTGTVAQATAGPPAAGGTGAGAVVVAVALVPAAAAAGARALDLSVPVPHVALLGAALALGGALLARRSCPGAALAGVAVALASTLLLPPAGPTPVHIAVAALIGAVAGIRLRPRGGRRSWLGGFVAAALPIAVASAISVRPLLAVLMVPYSWFERPWSTRPVDSRDGLSPQGADAWLTAGDTAGDPALVPIVLVLTTLAVGLLVRYGPGRRWLVPAVLPGAWAAVLVAPAAWALPWPAGVGAAALVAASAGIGAARVGRDSSPERLIAVLGTAFAVAAGLAALGGAAATRATTFATLGVAVVAGAMAGAWGRRTGARVAGWLVASVAGLLGATIAAGELDGVPVAAGPFAVAVILLGVAALLAGRDRRPAEYVPVEVVAHVAAFGAVAASATLRQAALVLVGYGAAVGLSALRPNRRGYAVVAGAAELLAWWLLLFAADVGVIEAYTMPFALVALIGGAVGLRTRPALRSWAAYGPALAAAFLPSLALVLVTPGEPLRRLLLGAGAIAVVVVGGARRRQAPVIVGAVVLVLVTLHELAVWWDLLPRWIPLAVGGLVLVSVGATYERRRRDLRALRTRVTAMR